MSLTTIDFLLGPLPQVIALLTVAIIGTILAIRMRLTQPRASLFTVLGIWTNFAAAFGLYAVRVYFYRTFENRHDAFIYGRHIAEANAALRSIQVAGVLLLVAAIFAKRVSARPAA